MHKKLINEIIIDLTIETDGPILIKAGESGADPTRPDMEFVRTYYDGKEVVYLPGSSLKGVTRSHAEKIARTVDGEREQGKIPLSCNPLGDKSIREDKDYSCNKYFNEKKIKSSTEIYKNSCFICKMFGNTAIASHLRIADAYPEDEVTLEERNGVAIDRIFGSVAVGPFQFEVATKGTFKTKIYVKNFTIAQLGLIALTLRDIQQQRVPIGFAKSRGLGKIKVRVSPLVIKYPTGSFMNLKDGKLYGVGTLIIDTDDYGFAEKDSASISNIEYQEDSWGGKYYKFESEESVHNLWVECVKKWVEFVQGGKR